MSAVRSPDTRLTVMLDFVHLNAGALRQRSNGQSRVILRFSLGYSGIANHGEHGEHGEVLFCSSPCSPWLIQPEHSNRRRYISNLPPQDPASAPLISSDDLSRRRMFDPGLSSGTVRCKGR